MLVVGIFYVIEGFLDVSLPIEDTGVNKSKENELSPLLVPTIKRGSVENGATKSPKTMKHLFNVKAGGIAGYLGMSLLVKAFHLS